MDEVHEQPERRATERLAQKALDLGGRDIRDQLWIRLAIGTEVVLGSVRALRCSRSSPACRSAPRGRTSAGRIPPHVTRDAQAPIYLRSASPGLHHSPLVRDDKPATLMTHDFELAVISRSIACPEPASAWMKGASTTRLRTARGSFPTCWLSLGGRPARGRYALWRLLITSAKASKMSGDHLDLIGCPTLPKDECVEGNSGGITVSLALRRRSRPEHSGRITPHRTSGMSIVDGGTKLFTQRVRFIDLDDIVMSEELDLLKSDIEGSEQSFLEVAGLIYSQTLRSTYEVRYFWRGHVE
jgi:hypothetical protein